MAAIRIPQRLYHNNQILKDCDNKLKLFNNNCRTITYILLFSYCQYIKIFKENSYFDILLSKAISILKDIQA